MRILFLHVLAIIKAILISCASAYSIAAAQQPAQQADWRHFRGDDRLTGRSTLKGRIVEPAVIWRGDAGSREAILEARLDAASNESIALPIADLVPPMDFDRRWQIGGRWLDLDGDGVLQRTGGQVGNLLSEIAGLERFEVDGNANRSGPAIARLFARQEGRWVERWKRPQVTGEDWTEGLVAASVPIAGDFDGDGKYEIAFQGFYWIYVIDAETGRLKAKARFLYEHEAESGRGYGWFGARDLDGDGRTEFVIVGDTQNLIAVLGYDADGKLSRRWLKVINYDAYRRISVVKPGLDPLHDIDGDGCPEIVVGIFNYDPTTGTADGDNHWHVWALDGQSGATKLDLKDHYLSGLQDLDGDRTAEIFTTGALGQLVPEPSSLTAFSFKGGVLKARWHLDGESFQLTKRDILPLESNSSAAGDRLELLTGPLVMDGIPVFFTRCVVEPELPSVRITAWQWDQVAKNAIRAIGSLTGADVELLAVKPSVDKPNILARVRWFDGPAHVATVGMSAKVIAGRRVAAPMSPAVIGRLAPGERPAVVVEGAGERVIAFDALASGRGVRWRKPGRGMSTGGGHAIGWADRGGLLLADTAGDGTLSTLAATTGPGGCARLVAYGPDGASAWHHDFSDIPGKTPVHNVEGLTMWFSGRFTDPNRYDILATPRPKSQEQAVLLRGTDGSVVWRRERVGVSGQSPDSRPVGGSWMAAADHNGDGYDDVIAMYPDLLYALDGRTGDLLLSADSQAIFPKAPIKPYNAMPIVADFRDDGAWQYLWGACDRSFGLLNRQGQVIWQETRPPPCGPGILPGLGDVDGDGRLEVLVVGQNEGGKSALTCYSGATGRILWKLPLPGDVFLDIFGTEQTPMPPATADLDGDSRDECVFTIGTTLFAAGATADGQQGRIVWKLEFPDAGRLGPPAIADIRGDNRAQIVVMGRNGIVYGIGDRSDSPKW